jgi:pimeloyl-ACP methyl ester carboxylesterase
MKKTINVSGTEVHLRGSGKMVMIMIHGWPDTNEIWDKQVAFFEEKYTCVTFTLPAFSKTDKRKYTLDEIVLGINAIVDAVSPNAKTLFLVHDWGCVFGYEFAMRYPDKVAKMVAVDVGDASSNDFKKSLSITAKLMAFSYQIILALGWLIKSDTIHKTMAKLLKAPSNIENIHAGMGLPYAMRWLNIAGGMTHLKPIIPSFPFYYAYATRKPFYFHSVEWIKWLVENPQNSVQSFDCSHWVMIDKENEFNESVAKWLASDVL